MKEQDKNQANNRRQFLKKSATGAVLMSLPAKSVWGACSVSGALSGNLSQNTDRHDCEFPTLHNGRKPGHWKKAHNKVVGIFSHVKQIKNSHGKNSDEFKDAKACYINHVNIVKGHVMQLPSELTGGMTHTVEQGLQSSASIYRHMAAAYLNAYFGLYSGYTGRSGANQLVNEIFLYYATLIRQGETVDIRGDDLGYNNNASTNWRPDVACV